jgi:hypothetical protein
MSNEKIRLIHHRADKYTRQSDIDKALEVFVECVENGAYVNSGLIRLVARGAKEHLAGGKAWKVKQGTKPLSLSFLAAYQLAKEVHTNRVIADYLNVELETAKGFNKKLGKGSSDDKIKFNFYVHMHKSMIKSGDEILDILKESYSVNKVKKDEGG